MNINTAIEQLLYYGLDQEMIEEYDVVYVRNQLFNLFSVDEYVPCEKQELDLVTILDTLLDYAYKLGLMEDDTVTERDIFDSYLMNFLVRRPSDFINKFNSLYETSKTAATDWYYQQSRASNYIRMNRINQNINWEVETKYGTLDMTINLSKPEKDPRDIAKAKLVKSTNYPKCLLCKENEGYYGRSNHPGRSNHRIVPLTLDEEQWFIQYSPYVYYNEHSIIFKGEHDPMSIKKQTFKRLLDFLDVFPHYFIGSNADLPIVGGSILSHDHFQGGKFEFALSRAKTTKEFKVKEYDASVGIVKWPMSVIRINSTNKEDLINLADDILVSWRDYTDTSVGIHAFTDDIPHNTITPIARRREGNYELDLVLRNNRTSDDHPMGIFHPHADKHNIKKENIGLIEVLGLSILPARLKNEIASLKEIFMSNNIDRVKEEESLAKHYDWMLALKEKYNGEELDEFFNREIGLVFEGVLEDAGVYKQNVVSQVAFEKFIKQL